MVLIRSQSARNQDYINSKLRPFKRRFPPGPIPGAQTKMREYGHRKLRQYLPQQDFRAPLYYSFTVGRLVANHDVPREGRTVRVTV